MTPIEFKAWDKKLKQFNRSVEVDCFGGIQEYKDTGGAHYPIHDIDGSGACEANERFILLQYTGYLDNKRAKVFKHDIVKRGDFYGFISFQNAAWFIAPHIDCKVYECPDFHSNIGSFEVVGNINEHPFLSMITD